MGFLCSYRSAEEVILFRNVDCKCTIKIPGVHCERHYRRLRPQDLSFATGSVRIARLTRDSTLRYDQYVGLFIFIWQGYFSYMPVPRIAGVRNGTPPAPWLKKQKVTISSVH